eukprot:TRINITY_DN23996_c0_g1_i3.p3 TRINITY_DN23996_c0_g1~~TRINITY_DN23996_c0_g1_i3.p3  ORF type:complete len:206 (+),score=46.15 TRINITY_DN23996_c0_g1_i3:635-1252(+)
MRSTLTIRCTKPVTSFKQQQIKVKNNPQNRYNDSKQQQQQQNNLQQLAKLAASGAVALSLIVSIPNALAVSGGGGISVALSGQDFQGQNLTKNSYTKATLRGTDFSGANARGVSFFGCIAKGAKFVGTDLSFADLESGFFEEADFTNAVLEGAQVTNAQFQSANIANTDWTDVALRKDVQTYLCSIASGTNPTTGVDTRESLVCF